MFKKIIVGILLVSVFGAEGAALAYQAATQEAETISSTPEPLAHGQGVVPVQESQQVESGDSNTVAQGVEGDPWQATGTIIELDDYGFDFTLDSGETVYVELGSTDYWQAQDAEPMPGMQATVIGSINADMIHANQVILADGQTLEVRSEMGQPLWSGGVENGQGHNAGQIDGEHSPEPQAQVDEWITIEGTLMSFQGGNMTMGTAEGELITFQTGQPRFFAEQGVTFQVGDEIVVVGFYEGEQFMVGDITQVSTGLRVMLRDPNGRPLWAGPGNNGNGNQGGGNGRGGNGGGARHSVEI